MRVAHIAARSKTSSDPTPERRAGCSPETRGTQSTEADQRFTATPMPIRAMAPSAISHERLPVEASTCAWGWAAVWVCPSTRTFAVGAVTAGAVVGAAVTSDVSTFVGVVTSGTVVAAGGLGRAAW